MHEISIVFAYLSIFSYLIVLAQRERAYSCIWLQMLSGDVSMAWQLCMAEHDASTPHWLVKGGSFASFNLLASA